MKISNWDKGAAKLLTNSFCGCSIERNVNPSLKRVKVSKNRLASAKPDFLLTIVRKPENWRPKNHFEEPLFGRVVSQNLVASYEEAYDDLVRCNRLSLLKSLDTWAVIQSVGVESGNNEKSN